MHLTPLLLSAQPPLVFGAGELAVIVIAVAIVTAVFGRRLLNEARSWTSKT